MSAHMSRDRLYALLRKKFYWKGMYGSVSKWIASCSKCSGVKTPVPKGHGLLQPIKTTKPFEIIAIDIMGPLPVSPDGYKYILNCIDLYTCWPEAITLKTLTAVELTAAFQRVIIARHSCPNNIFADQGRSLISKQFNQTCEQFGITLLTSSAYHHQTNGKVERFDKFMVNSLATLIKKDQTDWPKLIESCLFVYRTTLKKYKKYYDKNKQNVE